METKHSTLTGGLDDRLAELPVGDAGDLKLILMLLADTGVQIARTKSLMNEMNARGMFDNSYVEMQDGQPHHYYSTSPPSGPLPTKPIAEPPAKYLSSEQAVQYMGMDVKYASCTMSRLVKSRALPRRIKLNKLMFVREELDAFMAKGSWKGRGRPPGASNKPKEIIPRMYPTK